MKIYTGQAYGNKFFKLKELNLGIMISSTHGFAPAKEYKQVFCALDNGAFSCWQKGYPFQSDLFLKRISECYKLNIKLDFIVCPDIVTAGKNSLQFSLKWAQNELISAPRLALVVQDGMVPKDLTETKLQFFSHIFIGGSAEWKWKTVKDWVLFSKEHNKKCHIGQCGNLESLLAAYRLNVDSVDSTNFVRNETWHIIEEYYQIINKQKPKQLNLFTAKKAGG